jgi:glycosyltransferase involved in cell wall biosynthesis
VAPIPSSFVSSTIIVAPSADSRDGSNVSRVLISVVVPTRDRPLALARCATALAAQDAAELEVVVVDDGSRDRRAVAAALEPLPQARVVRSPGRGPATARNLGAGAARGEVVCFTDDDCEPRPDWARVLAFAAARAAGGVAAGLTRAPDGSGHAVVASQTITNHLQLASLRPDGTLGFAPTSNLACRPAVLAELPFDSGFPDAAGEDRDWWARALARGIAAAYEPRAVVVHRQHLSLPAFVRQQHRYGRGAVRFRRRDGGDRAHGDLGFYAGLLRAGFGRGPAVGGLVALAQAATAAGVMRERLRPA